jgi:hypothetical protein
LGVKDKTLFCKERFVIKYLSRFQPGYDALDSCALWGRVPERSEW